MPKSVLRTSSIRYRSSSLAVLSASALRMTPMPDVVCPVRGSVPGVALMRFGSKKSAVRLTPEFPVASAIPVPSF
jgi:hypothetical protein